MLKQSKSIWRVTPWSLWTWQREHSSFHLGAPHGKPDTDTDTELQHGKENGSLSFGEGWRLSERSALKIRFDILQLAQIFVFCSLPYRPTDERQISHTARLGDGSTVEVIFTAMRPDVSIAFGNDRGLLYWLIDKAIKEGTPHISWDHASEYLAYSGQGRGGRNRELLRERFLRIASTAITVVRKSGTQEDQAIMPIIRRISLPTSITGKENIAEKLERRKGRTSFGLQFDEDFVKDFMTHRVPVLRRPCCCNRG